MAAKRKLGGEYHHLQCTLYVRLSACLLAMIKFPNYPFLRRQHIVQPLCVCMRTFSIGTLVACTEFKAGCHGNGHVMALIRRDEPMKLVFVKGGVWEFSIPNWI